ncbi:MAG: pyrimidine/purine nucleoside phosphorylase [Spirochaetia bacterium]|nr:pyrimidine/purine nucleoside phosphorylase [Spirochaetia bacterium]
MAIPNQLENVKVDLKANVYFDGKVVSHTIWIDAKTKKTVGLIYPGTYSFNTDAPERMDIVAGNCRVKLAGENAAKDFKAGTFFDVPGKSSFEISVDGGLCEYLCSFL